MILSSRYQVAARAALLHILYGSAVVIAVAILVFGFWFAYPFRELSGGRELFILVMSVDLVCGPLLTLILYDPAKSKRTLWTDLGMVATLQVCALLYGLWTVWEVRPLFLVHEIDRFKVVASPDLRGASLDKIDVSLKPTFFSGPVTLGIRDPLNNEERDKVMLEALNGGADFAERPEFYIPYASMPLTKLMKGTKPLAIFLNKYPDQASAAYKLATDKSASVTQWFYLPVVARQDWVAVLDKEGQIQGFLKGDGF